MRAAVNDLVISFSSADSRIRSGWQLLFDLEIDRAHGHGPQKHDLQLTAHLVEGLPALPERPPAYTSPAVPNGARPVRYYENPQGGALRMARPAQIHFNFAAHSAELFLTTAMLDSGNLEDITMTALAPFFRRRGIYMAHAFAVAKGSALLLCGPSGSGKTTTGLALVEAGWHFLANDVTLIRQEGASIDAHLSPGTINLAPASLTILPAYRNCELDAYPLTTAGKHILPRRALLREDQLGSSSPVRSILFPTLVDGGSPKMAKMSAAIGLARLIEESVDQWDTATYEAHINFLTRLSRRARFFVLTLPRTGQAPHPMLSSLIDSL